MLTPLKSGSFSGDGGPSLGMTNSRRPIIRCEGVNGSDISSHETYICQGSTVQYSFYFHNSSNELIIGHLDFPMVFFRDLLVKPISLSKNPLLHGARSRLKVHPTCRFAKYSFTVGSFNVSRIMRLADLNVLALSEISSFGRPLLETNLLKHLINDLAESSVTTSKCTARTTAQVNRQF